MVALEFMVNNHAFALGVVIDHKSLATMQPVSHVFKASLNNRMNLYCMCGDSSIQNDTAQNVNLNGHGVCSHALSN